MQTGSKGTSGSPSHQRSPVCWTNTPRAFLQTYPQEPEQILQILKPLLSFPTFPLALKGTNGFDGTPSPLCGDAFRLVGHQDPLAWPGPGKPVPGFETPGLDGLGPFPRPNFGGLNLRSPEQKKPPSSRCLSLTPGLCSDLGLKV